MRVKVLGLHKVKYTLNYHLQSKSSINIIFLIADVLALFKDIISKGAVKATVNNKHFNILIKISFDQVNPF